MQSLQKNYKKKLYVCERTGKHAPGMYAALKRNIRTGVMTRYSPQLLTLLHTTSPLGFKQAVILRARLTVFILHVFDPVEKSRRRVFDVLAPLARVRPVGTAALRRIRSHAAPASVTVATPVSTVLSRSRTT